MKNGPRTVRPVGLMRVAGLFPIVAHLGRAGASLTRLLDSVGLPSQLFERPEALIPSFQAARFIGEATSLRGFEDVAFAAGLGTPVEALGVFGRLVRGAQTLRDALDVAVRWMPAFDSGTQWRVEHDGTTVRVCDAVADPTDGDHRQCREYRSALAMNVVRLAAGSPNDIRRLDGAISFPASLLERVLPAFPPRRTVPANDIDAWAASAPAADFLGSILQVIETVSLVEQPRIPRVANAIGMSVRALQRRLAQAGTTFAGSIARGRLGTAAELLEETDAAILDIALDLGYSDHAHFTRAFRRWTGVPPREFRRLSRQRGRISVRPEAPSLDHVVNG